MLALLFLLLAVWEVMYQWHMFFGPSWESPWDPTTWISNLYLLVVVATWASVIIVAGLTTQSLRLFLRWPRQQRIAYDLFGLLVVRIVAYALVDGHYWWWIYDAWAQVSYTLCILAILWLIPLLVRMTIAARNICSHCCYDLRGTAEGRCPECGTDIIRDNQY